MVDNCEHELPLTQAAARANRSEWTLRKWLHEGRVTGRKVCGRVLVNVASLDRLLAGEPCGERTNGAAPVAVEG